MSENPASAPCEAPPGEVQPGDVQPGDMQPGDMQPAPNAAPGKRLGEAARRALVEAEARRLAAQAGEAHCAPEQGGPKGPEPTRFGDWERKGLAVDF